MRLFVAATVPEVVRERMGTIRRQLEGTVSQVRWVRPEGIHLTLRFLGEVQPEDAAAIETALAPAGRAVAPFRLCAAGVGVFPQSGRPRVLWVGLSGAVADAERLAGAVDEALEGLGFTRDPRPFRAHVTLGRFKEGRGGIREELEKYAEFEAGWFDVRDFALFESRLGPKGASYSVLARFPLGPGGE